MDDPDYEYLKIPDNLIPKPGPGRVGAFSLAAAMVQFWALTTFYPLYRVKFCRWSHLLGA